MQSAQAYLEVINERGKRGLTLRKVYRNLQDSELFLMAYAKLSRNTGGLTPGVEPEDTIDGMSMKVIEETIEDLKLGQYKWTPARRIYIDKANGKKRPISIPSWRDKLLQEVLRMVLESYYHPQFSKYSHGFMKGRGCHTALNHIRDAWTGVKWIVKGDIKGCFDNFDHELMLAVIAEQIKDDKLLSLIRGMLKAGYLEDWRLRQTYSGTPQGGVISPLLANIFMNQLDRYMEEILIPEYTIGKRRKANPEYARLSREMSKAKKSGNTETYKELSKKRDQIPSKMPNDPNFKRLKYVRYADDPMIGVIGTKQDAKDIKAKVTQYLASIKLSLSQEKSAIIHATDGKARFLGYNIQIARCNSKKSRLGRSTNGKPMLTVPKEVTNKWYAKCRKGNKISQRPELINRSDYDIVMTYKMELQGLVNYYKLAHNVYTLGSVQGAYRKSLVLTLAAKHKTKSRTIFKRYTKVWNSEKAITVEVPRDDKKPLIVRMTYIPLKVDRKAKLKDEIIQIWGSRNELVTRLLADKCELCGAEGNVEAHHIRKLKDLKKRYQGRKSPPKWVMRMIELRRKTLIVCKPCHNKIHQGQYDGPKLI